MFVNTYLHFLIYRSYVNEKLESEKEVIFIHRKYRKEGSAKLLFSLEEQRDTAISWDDRTNICCFSEVPNVQKPELIGLTQGGILFADRARRFRIRHLPDTPLRKRAVGLGTYQNRFTGLDFPGTG